MQPEISRRCLSCGAAARAGSRFCPQCGHPLEAEAAALVPEERGVEAARVSAPTTGEWSQPSSEEWTPPAKEFAAFEESVAAVGAPSAPAEQTPVAPVVDEVEPAAPAVDEPESSEESAQESEEAARAGDLRVRVARVREGTRARVGRMREEAIVVLEETPDDSGLRFVLAAAAFFVLFLGLLFLSTTVLR